MLAPFRMLRGGGFNPPCPLDQKIGRVGPVERPLDAAANRVALRIAATGYESHNFAIRSRGSIYATGTARLLAAARQAGAVHDAMRILSR
jgi:hypothetical protein